MGSMEFEMEKNWYPITSRYVTYVTRFPELHGSKIGISLQILIDKMGINGTKSTFLGSSAKNLPDKIRVKIEWDDPVKGD